MVNSHVNFFLLTEYSVHKKVCYSDVHYSVFHLRKNKAKLVNNKDHVNLENAGVNSALTSYKIWSCYYSYHSLLEKVETSVYFKLIKQRYYFQTDLSISNYKKWGWGIQIFRDQIYFNWFFYSRLKGKIWWTRLEPGPQTSQRVSRIQY